jgi:hypothetical protein
MRKNDEQNTDIEICKHKIKALLAEYRCYLMSADEWHDVLIVDKDTKETLNMN